MEKKENDLILNMIANPAFEVNNFADVGLDVSNTSLLDKDRYKASPTVQKTFTDENGKFNDSEFDKFYDKALNNYQQMSLDDYDKISEQQITYHRDNIWAPKEKRRTGPDFQLIRVANPDRQTSSLISWGEVGERKKSRDELAQANKVLLNPVAVVNGAEAEWGETPNEGFFKYFTEPLVMAAWDEDGTHTDPFTGEEVEHKKGDLKLNEDGTYYYEKLDGRDVYGKQVLNKLNVLTEDGSTLNKFDFFDSDDIKQKSIGGSILKNAVLIGSMFLPVVGPWIAGASVATQLVGLTGTLGKMLTGSDSPTFSKMEGWAQSMNRQMAKTEEASESVWNWESFINMIGDTMGLLQEQRFIFNKVPSLLKGKLPMTAAEREKKVAELAKPILEKGVQEIEEKDFLKGLVEKSNLQQYATRTAERSIDAMIKSQQEFGSLLSKAYMTAITVGDTYGEAKLAGASDLDATVLTLGYAAGEYGILNTGLGELVLPELRAESYRTKAIAKALAGDIPKLKQSVDKGVKESRKNYIKKLFNIGKNIAKGTYVNGTRTLAATAAAGLGEGIEEVSEEVLADFSKGCYNTVKWIQGDDTRLNSFGYQWDDQGNRTWNGQDVWDRYGMSFVGGLVGGSLNNVATNYKMAKTSFTQLQAVQEAIWMCRNEGLGKLRKAVDKLEIGSKHSSLNYKTDENGNILFLPGSETDNFDVVAKKGIHKQLDLIESLVNSVGGNLSDEKFIDKNTLGDIRFSKLQNSLTAGLFLNEFNTKLTEYVLVMNLLKTPDVDANGDGVETDAEKRKAKKEEKLEEKKSEEKKEENNGETILENNREELKQKAEKLRLDILDLVNGKRADEFVGCTIFEMNSALANACQLPNTLPLYCLMTKHKNFDELTDIEKEHVRLEYQDWRNNGDARNQFHQAYKVYKYILENSSDVISGLNGEFKNQNSIVTNITKRINAVNNMIASLDVELLSDKISQLALNDVIGHENMFNFLKDNELLTLETLDIAKNLASVYSDETLEELDKKDQIKNLTSKLREKVLSLFEENLEKVLTPFIERGFANVETKNLLINSLNSIKSVYERERLQDQLKYDKTEKGIKLGEVSEFEVADEQEELETKINKYSDKIEAIDSNIKLINDLKQTPFEENFNKFLISIGREKISITDLIQRCETAYYSSKGNIDSFNLDLDLQDDLENAITTLEIYKATILGASTDHVNYQKLYAHNATVNEICKKLGKESNLAEIDSKYADVLCQDIENDLSKLKYLRTLIEVNSGKKLEGHNRIEIRKNQILYKKLREIILVPDDDDFRKYVTQESLDKLLSVIDGCEIHASIGENIPALNEELLQQMTKEHIQLQDAIYDFFHENPELLSNPDALKSFISSDRFDLMNKVEDSVLNEGSKSIGDPYFIWWLASNAAVKASDFYGEYKDFIGTDIVPIASQEIVIHQVYGFILNGQVYDKFFDAYTGTLNEFWDSKSKDEKIEWLKSINSPNPEELSELKLSEIIQVPRYKNLFFIEGIPGAGKTQAIIKVAVDMLKKNHPNAVKNAIISHGADGLTNEISEKKSKNKKYLSNSEQLLKLLDVTGKAMERESLMKYVTTNYEYWKNDGSDDEMERKVVDGIIDSGLKINTGLKPDEIPSIIVIDEVTKYNLFELQAIQKFSDYYGISVITMGDFDLESSDLTVKVNNTTMSLIPTASNFIRSPKQGFSMRTDNMIKSLNNETYRVYKNSDHKNPVKLLYIENEEGLFGDKVYNPSNESFKVEDIINNIKDLVKTLEPGEKIGFVYDNTNSELYKALKSSDIWDKYIDDKGNTAQGSEARYYIIDLSTFANNLDMPSVISTFDKKLYTGLTRALQGSIIVLGEYTKLSISSEATNKAIKSPLTPEIKKRYSEKRKARFDYLESKVVEEHPRKSLTKIDLSDIKSKEDLINRINLCTSVDELNLISREAAKQLDKSIYDNEDVKKVANDKRNSFIPKTSLKSKPEEKKSKPVIIPTLSKDDQVLRWGDRMLIDKIVVTVGDKTVTLPLSEFELTWKDIDDNHIIKQGKYNIVDYIGRKVVVVKVGDFYQPFYCSSGKAGKIDKYGNPTKRVWYPIFGVEDGWLNKGTDEIGQEEHNISDYYNNKVFKAICEALDDAFGTMQESDRNKIPEKFGPYCAIDEAEKEFLRNVNQSLKPKSNEDARANLTEYYGYIDSLKLKFQEQWDSLQNESIPDDELHKILTDEEIAKLPDDFDLNTILVGNLSKTVELNGETYTILNYSSEDPIILKCINYVKEKFKQNNNITIVQKGDELFDKINELLNEDNGIKGEEPVSTNESDSDVINDVHNPLEYQLAIAESNELLSKKLLPEREIKVSTEIPNTPLSLDLLFYTMNTFESGFYKDEQGNYKIDSKMNRIDNIYGLLLILKLYNASNLKGLDIDKDTCDNILGKLFSIIANASSYSDVPLDNKANLKRNIAKFLGLKEDEITNLNFLIKCSSVIHDSLKNNPNQNYVGKNFDENKGSDDFRVYDLNYNKNERLSYVDSDDSRSDEVNAHKLVMRIETKTYGEVLEIPIGVLTSPITLVNLMNGNTPVFPELKDIWDKGKISGLKTNEIRDKLIEATNNNIKYKNINNLLKLFQFLNAGVFRINDENWFFDRNIVSNEGAKFLSNAGIYQYEEGMKFNSDPTNSKTWISLSDFAKNPRRTVSEILKSKNGKILVNGEEQDLIMAGNPFVLTSYDPEITSTLDMIDLFVAQQQPGYKGVYKVVLTYVKPPVLEFKKYIEYRDNQIFGRSNQNDITIGNEFTSYRIFKILLESNDPIIKSNINKELPVNIELITKFIEDNKNKNKEGLKAALNEIIDFNGLKIHFYEFLSRCLCTVAYNKTTQTITGKVNVNNGDKFTLNEEFVSKCEKVIRNNGTLFLLFAKTKLANGSDVEYKNGGFTKIVLDYDENGKPLYTLSGNSDYVFSLNGKVDSYVYKANMDKLLEQIVRTIDASTGSVKQGEINKRKKGLKNPFTNKEETSSNSSNDFEANIKLTQDFERYKGLINSLRNRLKTDNVYTDLEVNELLKDVNLELENELGRKDGNLDLKYQNIISNIALKINSSDKGLFAFVNGDALVLMKNNNFSNITSISGSPKYDFDNQGNCTFDITFTYSNGRSETYTFNGKKLDSFGVDVKWSMFKHLDNTDTESEPQLEGVDRSGEFLLFAEGCNMDNYFLRLEDLLEVASEIEDSDEEPIFDYLYDIYRIIKSKNLKYIETNSFNSIINIIGKSSVISDSRLRVEFIKQCKDFEKTELFGGYDIVFKDFIDLIESNLITKDNADLIKSDRKLIDYKQEEKNNQCPLNIDLILL